MGTEGSISPVQAGRRAGVLLIDYPPDLPVVREKDRIVDAIQRNQVVIVAGETGSGKTTQLPKICLDIGRGRGPIGRSNRSGDRDGGGIIGHTQPRRLAARTVASRIAEELHSPPGELVGYKMRFTDRTGGQTRIKLMTDGILLAETQHDRQLRQYDTLIIDEAHERSLNIDFLLGYLHRLLPRRPDLKVIITSATIDPQRFSRHFHNAPVIEVSGRTYPVEVRYRPLDNPSANVSLKLSPNSTQDASQGPFQPPFEVLEAAPDHPAAKVDTTVVSQNDGEVSPTDSESVDDLTEIEGIGRAIDELWTDDRTAHNRRGDILIFLPTERDIHETNQALSEAGTDADILPLFARLSSAEQLRVFKPDFKRPRIVLATNVAETSVTVPGIRYVIDTGLARISRYSSRSKVLRLPVEPISRASADQRKGRCGRQEPGVCVRLYAESSFNSRPQFTEPEIRRTNLANVILQMKWLGLGRVEDFPFIDPPEYGQIKDGLSTLHELGAIDEADHLTPVGRRLAKLPVDPRIGRMIVAATDENCETDVIIIAAALSGQDVRLRPTDSAELADAAHRQYQDSESDFITYLRLWRALSKAATDLSNKQFRKFCQSGFISYMRWREWVDIHGQLCAACDIKPWADRTRSVRPVARPDEVDEDNPWTRQTRDAIGRSLLSGLISNVAMKADAGSYTGARGNRLSLWPGSALSKSRPPWVVAAEVVETSRRYARTVAPVRTEWVERAAAHLLKRTHTEPHWVSQTAHVHAFEKVTLYGLPLVHRRSVHFGPIDPKQSREIFIRHALVDNDFRSDHPAVLHNQEQVRRVLDWQVKARLNTLLTDAGTRYAFFDARVPPKVYSGPTFAQWTGRGRDSNWHDLKLTPAELIIADAAERLKISLLKGRSTELKASPSETPVVTSDENSAVTSVVASSRTPVGGPINTSSDTSPDPITALAPLMDSYFPQCLIFNGVRLPTTYIFAPGEADDGVTVTAPVVALTAIDEATAEWLVPGRVNELVETLIRSLPKALRTQFVPVSETADRVSSRLPVFGRGSLFDHVAAVLWKIGGRPVRGSDFNPDQIPDHLRLNIRVVDSAGVALAESRDLSELRTKFGQKVRQQISALADQNYTRDNLTHWDFEDLPERVDVDSGAAVLSGYPTLVEQEDKVVLRLLDSPQQSRLLMPGGLRRLFMIEAKKELHLAVRDLPELEKLRLAYHPFGSGDQLQADLSQLTAERALGAYDTPVRTREEFALIAARAWKQLFESSRSIGRSLLEILDRHRQLSAVLNKSYPPLLIDSIDDMRGQLSMLLPKRFARSTPVRRLEQVGRYLRGIDVRLTRLNNAGLARDLQGLMTLRPRATQFRSQWQKQSGLGLIDPTLLEHRWLLEEFRIQLFAQELKTAVPVSEKRVDDHWQSVKKIK